MTLKESLELMLASCYEDYANKVMTKEEEEALGNVSDFIDGMEEEILNAEIRNSPYWQAYYKRAEDVLEEAT